MWHLALLSETETYHVKNLVLADRQDAVFSHPLGELQQGVVEGTHGHAGPDE